MRVEPDLILRARAGDRRALEDLIRITQAPVAGFIAARVGDRDAVADVCQAAFVKMALALHKLRSPETFESWLYRIAENACRDFLRRERFRRRFFVRLEPAHAAIGVAEQVLERPELADLRRRLDNIDPGQRTVLALSLEKPRTYAELAELTHLSVPAVKSRLFRARAALRGMFGRKETKHES